MSMGSIISNFKTYKNFNYEKFFDKFSSIEKEKYELKTISEVKSKIDILFQITKKGYHSGVIFQFKYKITDSEEVSNLYLVAQITRSKNNKNTELELTDFLEDKGKSCYIVSGENKEYLSCDESEVKQNITLNSLEFFINNYLQGKDEYSLLSNNCQHFTQECYLNFATDEEFKKHNINK